MHFSKFFLFVFFLTSNMFSYNFFNYNFWKSTEQRYNEKIEKMIEAIAKNDLKVVKEITQEHPNMIRDGLKKAQSYELRGKYNENTERFPILVFAIEKHSNTNDMRPLIHFLIENGAPYDSCVKHGSTFDFFDTKSWVSAKKTTKRSYPLTEAIWKDLNDVVRSLLENGYDPNMDKDIFPALHSAVLKKNASMVFDLLKYGADIQVKDQYGKTCLERAREDMNESHDARMIYDVLIQNVSSI